VMGDRVFVSDGGNQRVSVHQLDGTFVRSIGSEGAGNGQFDDPYGVAVAGDRLYVADSCNDRVQVFL
jgi:DNA-binding beta-propeller fold protein YncE